MAKIPDVVDDGLYNYTQETTGIAANGAGVTVNTQKPPTKSYSMHVIRTAGVTDVVEVDLQGSLNNVNWFELATVTSVAGGFGVVHAVDKPAAYIRYNVVTIGAGNTLTVNVLALSY